MLLNCQIIPGVTSAAAQWPYMDSSPFASIPFSGWGVRLLTYIRSLTAASALEMLVPDGLFAR